MLLTAKDLYKNFGEKQVLKGVGLQAQSGRALGLLGRNGAGKTTAIRIMMQVFPADSGEVLLDGKPLDLKKVKIGYLPEERGLYPKRVIMEQLIYFGALRGMKTKVAKDRAIMLLKKLGMEEHANKKLDTLSKGNQQKIQLVATLISDPDIVILDEPFSGLDPVNAKLLEDLVKEQIQQGKVVFFSSHQMNYIEEFCDDIAILNQGQIVLSGNIREIKRGYDRSTIVVSGPNPAAIRAFAEDQLGGLTKKVSVSGGDVRIALGSADQKNALMAALAGQGLDVDAFRVYEPSLNDIFVSYTEGAI